MRKHLALRVDPLETRVCPSVTAILVDGNLAVQGDATGAVAITATAAGTFSVTDNGAAVDTVSGVTRGVDIQLESQLKGVNDNVTVDLGAQTVDHVLADLGSGNNSFLVEDGTITGDLSYSGKQGNDQV